MVANNGVTTSRTPRFRAHTHGFKDLYPRPVFSQLSVKVIKVALEDVKAGKAPVPDGIHLEFFLNCGK